MPVSTQQSISDLNKWKEYFSDLKNYFQTHGLTKEGIDRLYQDINNTLPEMSIVIGETEDIRLRSILSNFNQDQNYRSNSSDYVFILNLTTEILKNINGREQQEQNPRQERTASIRRKPNVLPIAQRMPMEERLIATEPISVDAYIKTLQVKQDNLQQQLDNLEANKPSIIRIRKHIQYNQEKSDLKSTLHKASEEKWETIIKNNEDTLVLIKEERSINDRIQKLEDHIEALKQDLNNLSKDKKILQSGEEKEYDSTKEKLKSQLHEASKEKWKSVLVRNFEESRNKQLDKVAGGSKFINRVIEENLTNEKYFYMRGREGYQYRTLGEIADRLSSSKDTNYGDLDKYTDWRILCKNEIKEIETFLEDKDKTLTKWDEKALNEIRKDLQKEKKKSDQCIKKSVLPQSTLQGTLVQQRQKDISTASVLMF